MNGISREPTSSESGIRSLKYFAKKCSKVGISKETIKSDQNISADLVDAFLRKYHPNTILQNGKSTDIQIKLLMRIDALLSVFTDDYGVIRINEYGIASYTSSDIEYTFFTRYNDQVSTSVETHNTTTVVSLMQVIDYLDELSAAGAILPEKINFPLTREGQIPFDECRKFVKQFRIQDIDTSDTTGAEEEKASFSLSDAKALQAYGEACKEQGVLDEQKVWIKNIEENTFEFLLDYKGVAIYLNKKYNQVPFFKGQDCPEKLTLQEVQKIEEFIMEVLVQDFCKNFANMLVTKKNGGSIILPIDKIQSKAVLSFIFEIDATAQENIDRYRAVTGPPEEVGSLEPSDAQEWLNNSMWTTAGIKLIYESKIPFTIQEKEKLETLFTSFYGFIHLIKITYPNGIIMCKKMEKSEGSILKDRKSFRCYLDEDLERLCKLFENSITRWMNRNALEKVLKDTLNKEIIIDTDHITKADVEIIKKDIRYIAHHFATYMSKKHFTLKIVENTHNCDKQYLIDENGNLVIFYEIGAGKKTINYLQEIATEENPALEIEITDYEDEDPVITQDIQIRPDSKPPQTPPPLPTVKKMSGESLPPPPPPPYSEVQSEDLPLVVPVMDYDFNEEVTPVEAIISIGNNKPLIDADEEVTPRVPIKDPIKQAPALDDLLEIMATSGTSMINPQAILSARKTEDTRRIIQPKAVIEANKKPFNIRLATVGAVAATLGVAIIAFTLYKKDTNNRAVFIPPKPQRIKILNVPPVANMQLESPDSGIVKPIYADCWSEIDMPDDADKKSKTRVSIICQIDEKNIKVVVKNPADLIHAIKSDVEKAVTLNAPTLGNKCTGDINLTLNQFNKVTTAEREHFTSRGIEDTPSTVEFMCAAPLQK